MIIRDTHLLDTICLFQSLNHAGFMELVKHLVKLG